jgi:hypothetical protein
VANKYIRHGETFNGDGTTSAAAASNGGVGAWNNINVLEGTAPAYGALAAGDTVFIRSKDAGGADITRVLTASLAIGTNVATAANPVSWVLDSGAVWTGIDGTLTFETPSTWLLSTKQYNSFRADKKDGFVHRETNASAAGKGHFAHLAGTMENWFLDHSAATLSYGTLMGSQSGNITSLWLNCRFKLGKYNAFFAFFYTYYGQRLLLVNPSIELTVLETAASLFYVNDGTGLVEIQNGELYGTGATTGAYLFHAALNGAHSILSGFKSPITVGLYKNVPAGPMSQLTVFGSDGIAGGSFDTNRGRALSRLDGYYPTLDARLPDSLSTPWSWWIYPYSATVLEPFSLSVNKLYTAAAAVKTITLQVLVSDTFTAIDKSNLYAVVSYIDNATGRLTSATTRVNSGGALATSTAPWSATSYPSVSLSKKALSITTATSIKQNTLIGVALFCDKASASANDVVIMCPDFAVL